MTGLLSQNAVALWYLLASVLFILALKGLSHPRTARQGNRFGNVSGQRGGRPQGQGRGQKQGGQGRKRGR